MIVSGMERKVEICFAFSTIYSSVFCYWVFKYSFFGLIRLAIKNFSWKNFSNSRSFELHISISKYLHFVSNFPFTTIYISCLICGSSNQINNNNEQFDCQNADSCDCTCRCISQKEIVNFF